MGTCWICKAEVKAPDLEWWQGCRVHLQCRMENDRIVREYYVIRRARRWRRVIRLLRFLFWD